MQRSNFHSSNQQPTILFDFDGTLADTKNLVLEALNDFARDYRLPPIDKIGDIRQRIMANKLYLNIRLLRLKTILQNYVLDKISSHAEQITLQNNLATTIKQLHKEGYLLGIVTRNRETTVRNFLKAHGLEQAFGIIKSTEDKRLTILELIHQHHLIPENLFYLCDQADDLVATNQVANTIAVTWGYESEQELFAERPHFMISDSDEILEIVDNFALYQDNSFCGLKFANYLSKAKKSESINNTTKINDSFIFEYALSKLPAAYHSKIINQLINLYPSGVKVEHTNHWFKAALLIAVDHLFDENLNLHNNIAKLLNTENPSYEWNESKKLRLLQLYIQHFIFLPLKKCLKLCGYDDIDLNAKFDHYFKNFEINDDRIRSLQDELQNKQCPQGSFNQFLYNYIYSKNKYLFGKLLSATDMPQEIIEQGNVVLKEIEKLKLTISLPEMPKLLKCLTAINKVVQTPSHENLRNCAHISEEMSLRSTYQVLGYVLKTFLSQVTSCLSWCLSRIETPKLNANPLPIAGSSLQNQGFFARLRYLPIKDEIGTFLDLNKKRYFTRA